MKYVAAVALLNLAGTPATEDAVKALLSSVGVNIDAEKVSQVIAVTKGKSVDDLIRQGLTKVAVLGNSAPATGAPAPAAKAPEAKKEEKKEEPKKEEDDFDGAGDLFDF